VRTSEQIAELSAALAKAAAKFPTVHRGRTATVYPKDKEKRPYSYDYADLDDVLSAVRGPLAENGLTLWHDCKVTRDPLCVEVTARLDHSSGQFKESDPLPMPCEGTMSAAQQIGSASTYGKRYTSQNILGISTEADDDGNAAADHDATTEQRAPRQPNPTCPKCGTNENVIKGKAEFGGGWLCWKKPEQGKHGCGHKWQDTPAPEAEPPKANGKAAAVAAEHGMKTGLDLEAEQKAFDAWASLLVQSTPEKHGAVLNTLKKAIADGRLTSEFTQKVIARALQLATKAEHIAGIEKLIPPLCEAAKIDTIAFAELLPAAEDRIGVTAGAGA